MICSKLINTDAQALSQRENLDKGPIRRAMTGEVRAIPRHPRQAHYSDHWCRRALQYCHHRESNFGTGGSIKRFQNTKGNMDTKGQSSVTTSEDREGLHDYQQESGPSTDDRAPSQPTEIDIDMEQVFSAPRLVGEKCECKNSSWGQVRRADQICRQLDNRPSG